MTVVDRMEALARRYHEGQTRKDGKTPYVVHPEAVVARLRKWGVDEKNGEDDVVSLAVAWGHDLLEDTAVAEDEIRAVGKLGARILAGINALTFVRHGVKWNEEAQGPRDEAKKRYIAGIGESASPEILIVKIADRLSNALDFLKFDDRKAVEYIDAGQPLFAAAERLRESLRTAVTDDIKATRERIYAVNREQEAWECLAWDGGYSGMVDDPEAGIEVIRAEPSEIPADGRVWLHRKGDTGCPSENCGVADFLVADAFASPLEARRQLYRDIEESVEMAVGNKARTIVFQAKETRLFGLPDETVAEIVVDALHIVQNRFSDLRLVVCATEDALFNVFSSRINQWATRMYFKHELIDWKLERLRHRLGGAVPEGSLADRLRAVARICTETHPWLRTMNAAVGNILERWGFTQEKCPMTQLVASVRNIGWECTEFYPVFEEWAGDDREAFAKELRPALEFEKADMEDRTIDGKTYETVPVSALALEIANRLWWARQELGEDRDRKSVLFSFERLSDLMAFLARFDGATRKRIRADFQEVRREFCARYGSGEELIGKGENA